MEEKEAKEIQALNNVIQTAIQTMEQSKEQIFEIAENARIEGGNIKRELDQVTLEVEQTIRKHDELERKYKKMRLRLMEVSRNLQRFSEQDIREAYEQANQVQIELHLTWEREQYLRRRRDELQLRLKNLERTIERAETLMSQVGVVLGYLQGDISRMSKALESAKNGHLFGLKIIEAQEEERKRVAREIHDGPAQSMANVVLRADIVEKILNQGHLEIAKEELRDLKRLVRNSLSDVRKIIYDLRPMALDDLGLVPTLRKFVEAYVDRYPITLDLKTTGVEVRLPSSYEVALFRLVQEGINNIVKHAKATHAEIRIDYRPTSIFLTVKDNGIGFKEELVKCGTKFGLMGMRERVNLLDGELTIISAPGQGTEIRVMIPISPNNTVTSVENDEDSYPGIQEGK